jgi:hypothetical protein
MSENIDQFTGFTRQKMFQCHFGAVIGTSDIGIDDGLKSLRGYPAGRTLRSAGAGIVDPDFKTAEFLNGSRG